MLGLSLVEQDRALECCLILAEGHVRNGIYYRCTEGFHSICRQYKQDAHPPVLLLLRVVTGAGFACLFV